MDTSPAAPRINQALCEQLLVGLKSSLIALSRKLTLVPPPLLPVGTQAWHDPIANSNTIIIAKMPKRKKIILFVVGVRGATAVPPPHKNRDDNDDDDDIERYTYFTGTRLIVDVYSGGVTNPFPHSRL